MDNITDIHLIKLVVSTVALIAVIFLLKKFIENMLIIAAIVVLLSALGYTFDVGSIKQIIHGFLKKAPSIIQPHSGSQSNNHSVPPSNFSDNHRRQTDPSPDFHDNRKRQSEY